MVTKRLAALVLCAVLALGVLAGCGGSAATEAASQAGASSAASSEAAPGSKSEAAASGILPSDDENSLYALSDPAKSLESSIGWGPGTAGTSLKRLIAAADMLKWAEDNNIAHQSQTAAASVLQKWYDSLTSTQQEGLSEAWPLIKESANILLTDKDSVSGLIEDAGLAKRKLPGCTEANWNTMEELLDDIIPATELQ